MSAPNRTPEKKRAEVIRHIALLHAQNETFLLHADALDRYCEACTASGNMAAAAAWRRLANQTRGEAHWFSFRAEVLEDSTKHIMEPQKCA
ncbi:MAG: hypothetical protein ABF443_00065 [Acetobacter malorum]|uniref:hypothetical protein n=1 Tax=Acetobacter malorum TaxID=178901 RepID=UPI0039E904CA